MMIHKERRPAVPLVLLGVLAAALLPRLCCATVERVAARIVHGASVPVAPPTPASTARTPPVALRAPRQPSGPDALRTLRGACFALTQEGYEYSLCPFANVTQRQVGNLAWNAWWGLLGTFEGWSTAATAPQAASLAVAAADAAVIAASAGAGAGVGDASASTSASASASASASPTAANVPQVFTEMLFTDGTDCNGKRRNASVGFMCSGAGGGYALKNASEPHTCEYRLLFACPEACRADFRVGRETPPEPEPEPSASASPSLSASPTPTPTPTPWAWTPSATPSATAPASPEANSAKDSYMSKRNHRYNRGGGSLPSSPTPPAVPGGIAATNPSPAAADAAAASAGGSEVEAEAEEGDEADDFLVELEGAAAGLLDALERARHLIAVERRRAAARELLAAAREFRASYGSEQGVCSCDDCDERPDRNRAAMAEAETAALHAEPAVPPEAPVLTPEPAAATVSAAALTIPAAAGVLTPPPSASLSASASALASPSTPAAELEPAAASPTAEAAEAEVAGASATLRSEGSVGPV